MDINIHTIKEKNISRIEKKKPEYFFVCMGEPILFVYSSKVKESNHHTFCMWIDYAHKKKKKKKSVVTYLIYHWRGVIPSSLLLIVISCWHSYDQRREKKNNRRHEWSILCYLLFLYTRCRFLFFSLSRILSFFFYRYRLCWIFLYDEERKEEEEKKSRSFVWDTPTYIVIWW